MRIALFDPVGTFFSAPTLRCMLEEFDLAGDDVDVFLRHGGRHLASVSAGRAIPFPVPLTSWAGDLEETLRSWKWFLQTRAWRGWRALRSSSYDLAIGLNPEGVIAAHRLHQRSGTPFVYLSFEMMFEDELPKPSQRLQKAAEVAASRAASLILIQDSDRAQLLADENGLPLNRFAYLPVAPRASSAADRSYYLRERFAINRFGTVVLHAGTFGPFTDSHRLMDVLPSWPSDFHLVVNTFYGARRHDPFQERLLSLGLPNVHLADGALPPDEFATMVASADIGLALYKAPGIPPFGGRNIEVLGLSSGKLAAYALAGLPILCAGNPSLKPYLARYPFGEYADDLADSPRLLQSIRSHWTAHSTASRRFFLEHLDFDRFWPPIWQKTLHLIRQPSSSAQP